MLKQFLRLFFHLYLVALAALLVGCLIVHSNNLSTSTISAFILACNLFLDLDFIVFDSSNEELPKTSNYDEGTMIDVSLMFNSFLLHRKWSRISLSWYFFLVQCTLKKVCGRHLSIGNASSFERSSGNLFWNFQRYDCRVLAYERSKTFAPYCIYKALHTLI